MTTAHTTHTNHSNHSDKSLLNPLATQAMDTAKEIGNRAIEAAEEGLDRAQTVTTQTVKKYPLAAVGIAVASGLALGAIGYRMMNPPRPTMAKRLSEIALGATAISLFRKLF